MDLFDIFKKYFPIELSKIAIMYIYIIYLMLSHAGSVVPKFLPIMGHLLPKD